MSADGSILGYAKISAKPSIAACLKNEADVLDRLGLLDLKAVELPRRIHSGEVNGAYILVTDGMRSKGFSSPKLIGAAHFAFLRELQNELPSDSTVQPRERLGESIRGCESMLSVAWRARLEATLLHLDRPGRPILAECLAHGDFTPWNTYKLKSRLYVFDWEYAEDARPVGHDLCHFMLSADPLGGPRELCAPILGKLSELAYGDDQQAARDTFLCYLSAHAMFHAGRFLGSGSQPDAWEGAERYGRFIDFLLGQA